LERDDEDSAVGEPMHSEKNLHYPHMFVVCIKRLMAGCLWMIEGVWERVFGQYCCTVQQYRLWVEGCQPTHVNCYFPRTGWSRTVGSLFC